MIRPRWQKVWADLFSHKVRSLLVIASIAVGLFAIGMIATIHQILSADMRSGYAAVNPANVQIRSSPFEPGFVDRIRHLPGVAAAEGVTILDLQVKTGPDEWKPISIKAIPDIDEQAINRVAIRQGTWPPADHELVMDLNKLPEVGAKLGDTVEIKLPSGTVRTMPLVGVVQDQTVGASGGGGGFFLSPIQGYVTYDTLSWLQQPEALNALYATVTEGRLDRDLIRGVADTIMEEFEKNGYITFNSVVRRSIDHPNTTYLDAMAVVLFILGLLVVFLSGFLITNTLSALLNQQVQQIGVMKTIGGSRRQIGGVYMVLILVFSLIALAVAIPLSQQAAYALLEYLTQRINFNLQGYRTVPGAILLQAVIALVVPQIAGSVPILQGTRISVREALSGTAANRIDHNSRLNRLLSRIRGLSRPLLISLRNTFRQRVRLALTLLTLALGGAIFIATFTVRYSIENHILRLGRYFVADVNLTFNRLYRIEEVERDVLQVPGVAGVEGWGGARVELVQADGSPGESVQLVAPPVESDLIEPIVLEGRWIQPGDENAIVLSELFRDFYPELAVGDTIRLKVNGKETDWLVVGFFQFAGRSAGLFAYANYDYLARLTHTAGRSTFFRVVAAQENPPIEAQEALSRQVEAHLSGLGYEIAEVRAGLYLQESTSKGLNILTTFLLIMSLLMASVGSIGLMGTMSLNVMERTREIGVMRAIGGSNRAIINMVLVEGMLIGLLSWIFACMAALPIARLLADALFRVIFGNNAPLAITFTGNLLWLGLVIVLSVLASVIPAYNASRLTVREVLAYE